MGAGDTATRHCGPGRRDPILLHSHKRIRELSLNFSDGLAGQAAAVMG
jgi:hypothetical protein